MSYRAVGENVYQFGPAAGSSPGIQLEMIVTVSGLSGLRNAYVSVLSADGSSAISGASRWLDACAAEVEPRDARAATSAVAAAAARRTIASFRIVSVLLSDGRSGLCGGRGWPSCRRSFASRPVSVRSEPPRGAGRIPGDERDSAPDATCLRARVSDPAGPRSCRGRRPRGFPDRLAHGRPLRAGAREGEHVAADARPSPRGRPRPPREPPPGGAARPEPRRRLRDVRRAGRLAAVRARARSGGAAAAAGSAA